MNRPVMNRPVMNRPQDEPTVLNRPVMNRPVMKRPGIALTLTVSLTCDLFCVVINVQLLLEFGTVIWSFAERSVGTDVGDRG